MTITKAQRKALHRKWLQNDQNMSYRAFRASAGKSIGMDCVLIRWSGMTLGIEPDGYTHS
jgi:hypothetical protein